DLARSTDWIHPISAAEQDELGAALRRVQQRGPGWRELRREDFAIPRLARTLAAASDELEHGRGLVLLRRIPVECYTGDELRLLYWGIGLRSEEHTSEL